MKDRARSLGALAATGERRAAKAASLSSTSDVVSLDGRSAGWSRRASLAGLLLLVVVFILYANTIDNAPLGDDLGTVVGERRFKSVGGVVELFSDYDDRSGYRPLRSASYAIDYFLFKKDYRGYHLVNIGIHGLVTLAVLALARRLLGPGLPALFVALLFAIHPAQTEVVAYMSGRRDLLTTLFFLLGFLAFLRYRETRRTWHLALVLLGYVAGILAKEMAVTLPLVCLAYEIVQRQASAPKAGASLRGVVAAARDAIRRSPALYAGLFGLAAAFSAFTLSLTKVTKRTGWWGGSVITNFLTVARIHLHHLKIMLFPATLNATYSLGGFPPTETWSDPWAWAAVACIGLILAGLWWCLPRAPLVTFGGLWFLLTLLPISHIKPHHVILAERHLYLPSVGLFLLAAIGLQRVLALPRARRPAIAALAVVALLLAARTVVRNRDWRDDLTLFGKNVQTLPTSAKARYNLGVAYVRVGRLTDAERQLREAVRLRPGYSLAVSLLGKVLADQGRWGEAEPHFRAALTMDRLVREAADPFPNLGQWRAAHEMNLGIAHFAMGRIEEAERELRRAVSLDPRLAEARIQLGILLTRTGRLDEAERELRTAIEQRDDAMAHNNLGIVLSARGDEVAAEQEFRRALHRDPRLDQARMNLARLYLSRGRLAEAEREVKDGLSQTPESAVLHYMLASVHFARGEAEAAAHEAAEALRLDPRLAQARALLSQSEARLARRGRP